MVVVVQALDRQHIKLPSVNKYDFLKNFMIAKVVTILQKFVNLIAGLSFDWDTIYYIYFLLNPIHY